MKYLDFEWLTDEFMLYCRSTQLRKKTMSSYEQTLHLFGPLAAGCVADFHLLNDRFLKIMNYPEQHKDFRKPVSVTTINTYIRNQSVLQLA